MKTVKTSQKDKSWFRHQFSKLRESFVQSAPLSVLLSAHSNIRHRLSQLLSQLPEGATIASYKSWKTEVPTIDFESLFPQSRWVYPKVHGSLLSFHQPRGFHKNSWGIEEPTQDSPKVELHQIDSILVPGIVFDTQGHRLGSGKGFYDRALDQYQGLKVGIAYARQISAHPLPAEDHDIPVEYIVTENNTLQAAKGL